MQKQWKKASTLALTGVLMASQALTASAAGGKIDAEMSTKTPVIRVVVPTKMEVAVNEFMMGDTGSQVTSGAFTMKNVSEIPVNVKVTSTATIGSTVTLVSDKKAAQDSTDTEKPAMWLAAAAAVADNSGTLEYVGGDATDKTVAALTGKEANVTAFETKEGTTTAVQDFYLEAATAAAYEGILGNETADIGNGADYYKLTEATPATDDAAGVAKLAETQDVYVAKDGAVAANTPQALTKVAKGTAAASITNWTASTSKAYTIGAEPVAYATVKAATDPYLYIKSATAAAGDAAAFRYAGALSSAKSGWSTTDLSAIEIAYDITGITTSAYDEMKDDLTYGYMGEAAAEDDYVMAADESGNVSYTFVEKPTGNLTKLMIGGSDRSGAITAGNVSYNSETGVLAFNRTAATNMLANGGTVIATIGGTDYTLTYTK